MFLFIFGCWKVVIVVNDVIKKLIRICNKLFINCIKLFFFIKVIFIEVWESKNKNNVVIISGRYIFINSFCLCLILR